MKRAFLGAILAVASSAGACINDRDTLAFELRNVDALKRVRSETDHRKKVEAAQEIALRAIGGRFERFPPKYYEMRIARLEAQLSMSANEYDDLAVAYERLGRTDKAIEILLASKPLRKTKDDEYRFHANYGTFLVHKWLAQKDRADTKALEKSIAEIEKALKINPDSHFGRETVQLELERYWLQGYWSNSSIKKVDLVVGLSGIVMMGLCYELPDAYMLMTRSHLIPGQSILDGLAMSRAKELIDNDKPVVSEMINLSPVEKELNEDIKDAYKDLRADGEKVHQARLAYIEERLNRGEHPDTHDDFWKEWKEPPAPVLKRVGGTASIAFWLQFLVPIVVVAVLGVALVVFVWKLIPRYKPPV